MDVPFSNRMRFHAIFFLSLVSLVGACNLGSVSDQSTSPHAAATGGTSLPGGASTGGTTGTVPPPASLYEPLPPSVYVAKVKNLLIGSAPTAAEANAVITDANALGALIDQWMATPQYDEKMLLFFGDAFQQSQVGFYDFQNQSGIGVEDAYTYFDLRQSFARTALELVKEGQPFNTTMTTNRFMVTTPLLIFYAYDDTQVTDDAGNITDRVMAQNPNWYFRLEQSAGPVALSQTLDPNSPNYLTFYDPLLASNNGCSLPDPLVFNSAIQYPTSQLYRYLLGNRVEFRNANFLCYEQPPQDHSRVLDPNEFFQWRMVTIRRPQLGESTTPFWDVQTLRTASEIVLNIPRFGFFSTPAFLAGWQTNASNQSRVTMNQTLIVGLNHAFDGTDSTTAPSLAALDAGHAPQGSPCFTCHQTLDPMRQFFRNAYTLYAHEQTDANMLRLPGMFAYGGVSKAASDIADLGTDMATHPLFAQAWTQKLCTYATSGSCDETDSEFIRIARRFVASNYSWTGLVHDMFSSPLVTYATSTQTAAKNGVPAVIARRDHLCAALSNRLKMDDVCSLQVVSAPNYGLYAVQTIAAALPADSYSRGAVQAVQANDPSLFFRAGVENICISIASQVVDVNQTSMFQSSDPNAAIAAMVHTLMAITPDRDTEPLAILQGHYAAGLQSGLSPTDALQSTFVLACLSPSTLAVGF